MKLYLSILLLMVNVALADNTHTVEYGESLWKIAKKHYGSGRRWPRIYNANRDKVRNPNRIRPGQVLRIPSGAIGGSPRGYEYWKTIRAVVRAYCPRRCCCQRSANGRTAIGDNAWIMDGAAVAFSVIPKRTMMKIPRAGWKEADDTGPSPKRGVRRGQYRIEVRMASHRRAKRWGRPRKSVELYRKKR